MRTAVAHTELTETSAAAAQLVATCKAKLNGNPAHAALLFAALDYDHELLLERILEEFPGVKLIGCTTDGEVSSELRFRQDSATLIVLSSETVRFAIGMGRQVDVDAKAAVEEAVSQASLEGESPELCITVPAGLVVSASEVMKHMSAKLGSEFPIVGGVAGDDWRFQKTFQFCGSDVISNGVPVMLLFGELDYSIGVASGWSTLGSPAKATLTEGPRVRTINGKPAVQFYKKYLGEHVTASPEHPLAIVHEDGSFALRAPIASEEDGSILFVGDIPNGSTVQLTNATRQDILSASRNSIEDALASYPGECPNGALLFSCAARKQLLGTKTDQEYALLEDKVSGIETCGFYTYGEIAPHKRDKFSDFHNQTFVTVLLGSR